MSNNNLLKNTNFDNVFKGREKTALCQIVLIKNFSEGIKRRQIA